MSPSSPTEGPIIPPPDIIAVNRQQRNRTWVGDSPTSLRPSATRRSCASTGWRPRRQSLRQGRGVQSAGLGQGPARARRHRGGREVRRAQARPDGGRGHQRQHRHRPRHGVRRQGLSAGRDHGGELQRRAAQADALPRRQGGPDAGRAARHRHGDQDHRAGQDAWLVPDPPVRERGQRRHALAHHRARDRRRLQGRAARLLGDRLRHRRHAEGRRARAGQGDAGHEDRRVRADGRADAEQRRAAGAQPRRLAGGRASGVQAASDAGLDAGLHSEADRRCGRPEA